MSSSNKNSFTSKGVWIFVSHSNCDIHEIRRVRNELEALGHFPLLFFLRCLEDDDELDDLIKREISARDFFLLCESPNTVASTWVTREVEFIKSLPNRVWQTINLGSDVDSQLKAIRELSRRATIFMSYARVDWDLVNPLYEALVAAQYRVWLDRESLSAGDNFVQSTEAAIETCMREGFFLFFITPDVLARETAFFWRELHLALEIQERFPDNRILPILLGNISPDEARKLLPIQLAEINWLDLTSYAPSDAATKLVRELRSVPLST